MAAVLDRPWVELAAALPPRAAVLDLATGGGAVLAALRQIRSDLRLTGVDAAPLPAGRGPVTLRGGVRLERLPFPDRRFDAVTSRFGIEYAQSDAAAAEAARVLRPGGLVRLVIHHRDSVVLRHNLGRLAALRWAARDSGWPGKANTLARGRMVAPLPTPAAFHRAPGEARERFPGQSAAWELLTATVQVLDAGLAHPPEATLAKLAELAARAEGEIARLEALERAACNEAQLNGLLEALAAGGVEVGRSAVLHTPRGSDVLAWSVEARRI